MNCKSCGKPINHSYAGMCEGCYHYFKHGGQIYTLPSRGVIARSEQGLIICHICGRAYKRLGSHIKESHNMTIQNYKAEYGLCNNARTTEATYSQMMHNYSMQYEMDKQLIQAGQGTRIKKGETDKRKGKEVRLQEILDKRNRMRKEC